MHERRVEDLRLLRGFLGACSADAGANSSNGVRHVAYWRWSKHEDSAAAQGVDAGTRFEQPSRDFTVPPNSPALLEWTRSTLAREKSQCTTSPLLSRLPEISSHGLLGLRVARAQTCRDMTQCERLTLDPESRAQSRLAAE